MTADDLQRVRDAAAAFIASLPFVVRFAPIGSATYMPADQVGDIDFAVRLKMSQDATDYCREVLMAQHGFEDCADYDTTSGKVLWRAVRRGDLNLIVTTDGDWYERYLTATEVCKALRIADKAKRIAVCQIVRDGRTAEEVKVEDLFA